MSINDEDRTLTKRTTVLRWVVARVAVALGGAFSLFVLGTAFSSDWISLAGLVFPFGVWAQSVALGQRNWGSAPEKLGRPLFDESRKLSHMTGDERRRNGYPH